MACPTSAIVGGSSNDVFIFTWSIWAIKSSFIIEGRFSTLSKCSDHLCWISAFSVSSVDPSALNNGEGPVVCVPWFSEHWCLRNSSRCFSSRRACIFVLFWSNQSWCLRTVGPQFSMEVEYSTSLTATSLLQCHWKPSWDLLVYLLGPSHKSAWLVQPMVCQAVCSTHYLGHPYILSILPSSDDKVYQVPVPGTLVHQRRPISMGQAEYSVHDDQFMFCASS